MTTLFVCLECQCSREEDEDTKNDDLDNLICYQCIRDPGWDDRLAEEVMREEGLI
jgi:hypothetical protein